MRLRGRTAQVRHERIFKAFDVVVDEIGELEKLVLPVCNRLEFPVPEACVQVAVDL